MAQMGMKSKKKLKSPPRLARNRQNTTQSTPLDGYVMPYPKGISPTKNKNLNQKFWGPFEAGQKQHEVFCRAPHPQVS